MNALTPKLLKRPGWRRHGKYLIDDVVLPDISDSVLWARPIYCSHIDFLQQQFFIAGVRQLGTLDNLDHSIGTRKDKVSRPARALSSAGNPRSVPDIGLPQSGRFLEADLGQP